MAYISFVDIQYEELRRYIDAAEKKRGTCRVLPAGRFVIRDEGLARYTFDGLVCAPMDMGGEATGVAAEVCRNCVLKALPKKRRGKR